MTDRLQKINKFITITDRESRTKEFNEISKAVVQQLKDKDPFFGLLYKGWRLGGSYADKLKVKKADEFDLVLQLKIDEHFYDVKVTECSKFPGFCNIHLTEKQTGKRDKYQAFMSGLLNDEGFLIENKFNDWFNNLMESILTENDSFDNYLAEHSISGPAQTVTTISKKHGKTSYDFVPAFVFDCTIWVVKRKVSDEIVKIIPREDLCWIAIPKPLKECPEENKSFLTSFVNIERHFIKDKGNLKNTLRMMKKFRDVKNIKDVKSYFIKTIFLWENEAQNRDFWNKPAIDVLKHMFQKSIEYFENKNLPFFWHQDQNMIANLNQVSIDFILHYLNDALHKLETEPDKIYDIFLTFGEQQKLESQVYDRDNNLVEGDENASTSWEDYESEALDENKGSSAGGVFKKILKAAFYGAMLLPAINDRSAGHDGVTYRMNDNSIAVRNMNHDAFRQHRNDDFESFKSFASQEQAAPPNNTKRIINELKDTEIFIQIGNKKYKVNLEENNSNI